MSYAADVGYSFTSLLGNVISVVVKVAIFLAIVALGWFIASWIRRVLARFLRRVGFDRAARRGGLDRMLGRHSASDVSAQLVMYAVMLFVVQLAFGIFGPNLVSDLISRVIAWLPRFFVAVVILVAAAGIAGWVRDLIAGALGGLSYGRPIAATAQVVILVLGVFTALTQIGVANSIITPVLWAFLFAVTGIAVVGVGGGLVKPMQHRWERMLNRVETETTIAAERVRANRAAGAQSGWESDRNAAPGYQPAYSGTATSDIRPPATAESAYGEENQQAQAPPPTAEER
jgi:hypothetical protein